PALAEQAGEDRIVVSFEERRRRVAARHGVGGQTRERGDDAEWKQEPSAAVGHHAPHFGERVPQVGYGKLVDVMLHVEIRYVSSFEFQASSFSLQDVTAAWNLNSKRI